MQEQIEACAGLNGAGAGYAAVGETPDAPPEGAAAGDDARLTHRERIRRLMADPVRYADIKRRVTETDESLGRMARELGVDKKAFSLFIAEQGWPRPPTAPKAPRRQRTVARKPAGGSGDIAVARARLVSALDRQIDRLDARLRQRVGDVEEKDSRILGNLAKTLATLMQMGTGGTTSKDAEPADRGDVDQRLAERIKRWARGEQGY